MNSLTPTNPLSTAAVIVLVIAFVLYRQMMTRVATRTGLLWLALFMMVAGAASGGLVDPRRLPLSLLLLAVDVACAVAFGVLRASTVRVWRDGKGTPWSKGTRWTLLGWLASAVARVALLGAGHALGLASAPTAILFFMGVTIGVQSLLVARRARALPPHLTAPAHA
ncbi:hypothetical protein ACFYSC_30025 [Streptosporangium sp. NPDC004379]|uniref:hypothetical protein n=1 Tax=Streptosporangium sp. NPDC004379 TaxID=3366189 RepID=UPI0036C027ED